MNESWLRHPSHEKWALAALACQHPAVFCLTDGYCHYRGECFRPRLVKSEIVLRLEKIEQRLAALERGKEK